MDAFTIPLEAVEIKARDIHVFKSRGRFQAIKNSADPVRLLGVDASAIALPEKALQALVSEAPDHTRSVMVFITPIL